LVKIGIQVGQTLAEATDAANKARLGTDPIARFSPGTLCILDLERRVPSGEW
jgi:hypothetical protein